MHQEVQAGGFLPLGQTGPGDARLVGGATGQMRGCPFSKVMRGCPFSKVHAVRLKSFLRHPRGCGTRWAPGRCPQPRASLWAVGLAGPAGHPRLVLVVHHYSVASTAFGSIAYIYIYFSFILPLPPFFPV